MGRPAEKKINAQLTTMLVAKKEKKRMAEKSASVLIGFLNNKNKTKNADDADWWCTLTEERRSNYYSTVLNRMKSKVKCL